MADPNQQPPKAAQAPETSVRKPTLRVARLRATKADAATGRAQGPDSKSAKLPRRQYGGDAGLDLEVSQYQLVMPGATVRLPHNIAVELPTGAFGMIVPRSSTLPNKGLLVMTGIIDPGFRGEVQTVVYNPTKRAVAVNSDERLSQLLVLPLLSVTVEEVTDPESLSKSDRGEAGFGSSGGLTNIR